METTAKTILIVDDNDSIRKTIELTVKSLGYRTETAFEGRSAIKVLKKVHADCVLMDLDMPGMDGYATTDFIRKELHLSATHLPIIAITALTDVNLPEVCEDLEINAWALKPVNSAQMRKLLCGVGL